MLTPVEIKKVQNRLLEMAKAIRDVLEANGIPYFITYGTLLGAVRHQGFIPWDDDFDFYLFDDTYDEAIELLRANLTSDMFVEDAKSEPLFFHGWAHVKDMNSITECDLFPQDGKYAHKGISVDLYKAYHTFESDEKRVLTIEHIAYLKRRKSVNLIEESVADQRILSLQIELQKYPERKSGRPILALPSTYNDSLVINEIFPLLQLKFEDTYFYAPKCYDSFLKQCYHDYMMLPPIEHRIPHYSSVKFL